MKDVPIWLQILLGLLMLFVLVLTKVLGLQKAQNFLTTALRRNIKNIGKKDLHYNDVFIDKQLYYNTINSLKFESDEKTQLFKTILSTKLEIDLKILTELVDTENLNTLNIPELKLILYATIANMIEIFDARLESYLIRNYPKNYREIYELVMNSEKGINNWRKQRVDRLNDQVENIICKSKIFDNNYERVEIFLCDCYSAIKDSVYKAEVTFESFNGKLDNLLNK